ncbi:MAG: IS4 family transposase, partial [Deltaproteobacteria bacterium]|nr:IS4 family transposase [Deltaproteobacteria bacterium]
DSTVLRLHRLLEPAFGACRTNHTLAAAKLHVVMSVLRGKPQQVRLTPERTNDRTPWRRVGAWVQGMLLLFDLGYFSHRLFALIDANGGFFLTRLKVNANPLIVAVHRCWRGRSIPVAGRHLREVLGGLKRQVLDVEVEVAFERRAYRGRQSKATQTFRLVAIRNPETGTYHCYLTNIPADRLPAEDVTAVYALRWQIEILFKAMKHHGHLDHLPSSKQCVVECLIWASVLSMMVSRALFDEIRQAVPADRAMPQLR